MYATFPLMTPDKKMPGGRRKDERYKQVNLSLEPELIKKLKIKATELEINLSELAEMIFNQYFESIEKKDTKQ